LSSLEVGSLLGGHGGLLESNPAGNGGGRERNRLAAVAVDEPAQLRSLVELAARRCSSSEMKPIWQTSVLGVKRVRRGYRDLSPGAAIQGVGVVDVSVLAERLLAMSQGGADSCHVILVLVRHPVVPLLVPRMSLPLLVVHPLPVRPGAGLVEEVRRVDGQQHLLAVPPRRLLGSIARVASCLTASHLQLGDLLAVQLVDDGLQEVVQVVLVGGEMRTAGVRQRLLAVLLLEEREFGGDEIARVRMRIDDGEKTRSETMGARVLNRRLGVLLYERGNLRLDGLLRRDYLRSLEPQLGRK